jgi:lipopolysaccharide export LptBFGC system permease protein LptF
MQLLGRASIKYNGKLLRTEKGAKINTGGVKRKGQEGDTVLGFSEETAIPFVECEVAVAKGDSLLDLNKVTAATITFEADTGQTWILKDAWLTDPTEATAGDGGKVKLKFEGMSCEEML